MTLPARAPRTRGRLELGGGLSIGDAHSVEIYMKAITVHHAPPAFSPDQPDDWRRTIAAMIAGRFPPASLVSHRFGLDELQQAPDTAAPGGDRAYPKGVVLTDA